MKLQPLRNASAWKLMAGALVLSSGAGSQAENVQAQQAALVGDRPDFTESAATLPAGMVQLEVGATLARVEQIDAVTLGEVLVRVGLSPDWELRLGLNSLAVVSSEGSEDVTGLEDAAVGFKLRLRDGNEGGPALALLGRASLPTGAEEFSADTIQPDVVLAAAQDLNETASLGVNVGLGWPEVADERFTQYFGSVSLGFALDERWSAFGEWFALSEESAEGADTHYLDGGVIYLVHANLQIDARIGRGLQGLDSDWFAGFGTVMRW